MKAFYGHLITVTIVALMGLAVYKMVMAPRPRPVPDDEDHKPFVDADTCMLCHASDGPEPRPPSHPETVVCMDCH
jgi:hypothetical protein